MLVSTLRMQDYIVQATDGEVGRVDDLYVRREEWLIRHLLLKTALEPNGGRILISTQNITHIAHDTQVISLDLTQEQVFDSPDIDVEQPISKQHEIELTQYYGWPPDWLQEEQEITPTDELSEEPQDEADADETEYTGPELQSCNEITGLFRVQLNDAEMGKIMDFLVDDETWLIEYAAVEFAESETGQILLPMAIVQGVDWTEGHIYADASLDAVADGPVYDPGQPLSQAQQELLRSGSHRGS
ncbi:MAG: hypothetical protein IH624_16530 [Phycisphaerae bacterium]|nr:hypothetical protein [Phycisphaerae bacterium]